MDFQTEQEAFWAGEFGDIYIDRNRVEEGIRKRIPLWAQILRHISWLDTVIEFGANVGMNLRALRTLAPNIKASAIEINQTAVGQLRQLSLEEVHHQSILDFQPIRPYDLSFTFGVLIHVNPDFLPQVYEKLYQASSRYICICEYYNPTPVEVSYRGHRDKLFKRDFAGEMLDLYTDLHLVAYQFVYHRDPHFPADDVTWFLMQKRRG
jgi:pseudaminic acid biosynthesis-associated methylase